MEWIYQSNREGSNELSSRATVEESRDAPWEGMKLISSESSEAKMNQVFVVLNSRMCKVLLDSRVSGPDVIRFLHS